MSISHIYLFTVFLLTLFVLKLSNFERTRSTPLYMAADALVLLHRQVISNHSIDIGGLMVFDFQKKGLKQALPFPCWEITIEKCHNFFYVSSDKFSTTRVCFAYTHQKAMSVWLHAWNYHWISGSHYKSWHQRKAVVPWNSTRVSTIMSPCRTPPQLQWMVMFAVYFSGGHCVPPCREDTQSLSDSQAAGVGCFCAR